jgi:hypothetical protein
MKKKATLAAVAVITVVLSIGCKNRGGDTLSRRNKAVENEGVTLPAETLYNDQNTMNVSASSGITDNQYLWEIESVNPMIKYVGSKENFPPPAFPVDIDFTALSGTEFDEEFANIMFLYPNDYLGKTIRFVGQYSGIFDETDNSYKHYVVFDDPKGCCVRYIEFAWNDSLAPNSYPEKFAVVDVAGVFSSYYDETYEWNFNFLKVNGIAVLKGAQS